MGLANNTKEKIFHFLDKVDQKNTERDATHHAWHSGSYHRYFEGYAEYIDPTKGRNGAIVREYIGKYYVQNRPWKTQVCFRALYALLYAAALTLFLNAVLTIVPSNCLWYVTIFQAIALVGLGWSATAVFTYVTSKKQLKIYDYRTGPCALRKASLLAGLSILASAFVTLFLVFFQCAGKTQLFVGLKLLIAALLLLIILLLETHTEYSILPGKEDGEYAGYEIRNYH